MKPTGKRSAGNPHAAFDAAGAGNGAMGRTEAPAYGESRRQQLLPGPTATAPALDPTTEGFDTADLQEARALLEALSSERVQHHLKGGLTC